MRSSLNHILFHDKLNINLEKYALLFIKHKTTIHAIVSQLKGLSLKKSTKNTVIKNLCFIFALTLICSVLVHVLLSSETLSDYASQNPSLAYGSQTVSSDNAAQETATTSESNDTIESTLTEETTSVSMDTSLPETEASSSSYQETSETAYETTETNADETAAISNNTLATVTYQPDFYYQNLSDEIKTRITGYSYPADDTSAAISYDDLRYLHVLYYNFDNTIMDGEIICNKTIAEDLVEIFYDLYQNQYQIDKIQLIDDYNANDELSMENDNTSCFNYRVVEGTSTLSNHAYGLAIDLNPFYNPDVTTSADGSQEVYPIGSDVYADRSATFAHKIDQTDLAYQLFTQHGFTWGGNWHSLKDYQHFEKD